jgi:hypothetical protein
MFDPRVNRAVIDLLMVGVMARQLMYVQHTILHHHFYTQYRLV